MTMPSAPPKPIQDVRQLAILAKISDNSALRARVMRVSTVVIDGNSQITFLMRMESKVFSIFPSEDRKTFYATFSKETEISSAVEASLLKSGDEVEFTVHPDTNCINQVRVLHYRPW